jgi:hypothetical protein
MIQHLLTKHEALNSHPSTKKIKIKIELINP